MVLYEGPSMIDGAPIVAIATGIESPSRNRKTGPVVQVWILRQDISPVDAVKTGHDASVCGDCMHRHHTGGACYVVPGHAPQATWKAYRAGRYARLSPEEAARVLSGRIVRLGAYGDPGALPGWVVDPIAATAGELLAYSHAWRQRPDLAAVAMASVDSIAERLEAKAQGWRTFRVTEGGKGSGESVCPSADESKATRQVTCKECRACNGNARGYSGDIVIQVHGSRSVRFQESA